MTHLSHAELLSWRDTPSEADRARIVQHLAVCDQCAAHCAELIRTREPEEAPVHFDAQAFAARGYGAIDARRGRLLHFRPQMLIPLAAAAAILLAIWLPARRTTPDLVPTNAIRGSRPQAVSPAGQISGPLEFRWSSPVNPDRYAVEVKDASGRRVFYRETREERIAGDASFESALRPGVPYTWTVAALDAAGEVISRSEPATFVRGAAPR